MKIGGKVAVVIGGAEGMGRAFCDILLQKGAKVVMGDVRREAGERTSRELREQYGEDQLTFLQCNITHQQQIKAVFAACGSTYGAPPDIAVNVAGSLNEGDWRQCVDVNVIGTLGVCEEALGVMSKDKGGKGGVLILLASMAGLHPNAFGPVYSFTKFGAVGYCRSMGLPQNLAATGVRFNCLCPTIVDTAFLSLASGERARNSDKLQEHNATLAKNNMLLSPSFVAEGLVELIEDDSLSGQALAVTKTKGRFVVQFPDHPGQ